MKQQDIPNSRWEIEITSNPLVPTSTRFRPFKESSDAQNSPIESSKSSKLVPTIVENVCSIFDDVYQKIVNTKIGEINGGEKKKRIWKKLSIQLEIFYLYVVFEYE